MKNNKIRTFLTTLGVVVGIAAVIVVFSAGEGIYGLIVGQVESFGTDIIETEVKVPSDKKGDAGDAEGAMAMATGVQVTTLTLDDVDDITNQSSNIKAAYGAVMAQEVVNYQGESRKSYLMGVSAPFVEIDKSKVGKGRFFTEAEDRSLTQVAVIGSKMKEKLFGDQDPIGKFITLRKQKFEVIGVMEERGAVMFIDYDDFVYVPIRTLQKKIMGIDYLMYAVHQLKDTDLSYDTAEEARYILRQNHDITNPDKDDFRVTLMTEAMDDLKIVTNAITWLLLGIVAISLVVGGVGVMNIMYVIVSERTSEIGLRKAIGATFKDIMLQFLIESILITILGGIIGVGIGVGLSTLIAWGATSYGLDWRFIIPARAYVVALLFSVVFGVLFGLYPARQAARLEPTEALRNE